MPISRKRTIPLIDTAYTAGILDGEGSISLAVSKNVLTKAGRPRVAPKLRVSVGMTSFKTISWLAWRWGIGSISSRAGKKAHHKAVFIWGVTARDAEHLLRTCLPYMRTKKRQARLALTSRKDVRRGRSGAAAMKRRFGIKARLMALNQAGD